MLEYSCSNIIFIIWNLYYKWFVNLQNGQTIRTNIMALLTCFLIAKNIVTIKSKSDKFLIKWIENYVCKYILKRYFTVTEN